MARNFAVTAIVNARLGNIRTVVSSLKTQLSGVKAVIDVRLDPKTIANVKSLNDSLIALNKTLAMTATSSKAAAVGLSALKAAAAGAGKGLGSSVKSIASVTDSLAKVTKQTQAAHNAMWEFGRVSGLAIRRFSGFTIATGIVFGFLRAVTDGVKQAIDFQQAMVRVAQVTGGSLKSVAALSQEISRLSTTWGVSSKDLSEISLILAQAGLTAQDTKTAMEALAKTTLAPTFTDIKATTEGAIATMAQFGIGVNDLEKALSSINAVAAAFAVESDDIITAVRRTGGVFASASKGVSEGTDALNEFMAIFTSVRATTRESAESIATGLRTVFTRLQRTSTVDMLEKLGIKLRDLEGNFVGPFEAVNRLGEALSKLDPRSELFAAIAEELGGFRQIGKVIPMIMQTETRMRALAVAQQGQTSLTDDAIKAQQAWAVQLIKVREEFLKLIRDISETGTFKGLLNAIIAITQNLITLASTFKSVLPLLAAFAAFKGGSFMFKAIPGFFAGLKGKGGMAGGGRVGFATGGLVPGGKGIVDDYPATLTKGEYVIRRKAVDKIGVDRLNELNRGYAKGGLIKHQTTVGAALLKPIGIESMTPIESITPAEVPSLHGPKSYNLIRQSLPKIAFQNIRKILLTNIIDAIQKGANYLGGQKLQSKTDAGRLIKTLGIESIGGQLFEGILSVVNQQGIFDNAQNPLRPFDFTHGFNDELSKHYSGLRGINYIDAKYSNQSAQPAKIRSKIINQLNLEEMNKNVPGKKAIPGKLKSDVAAQQIRIEKQNIRRLKRGLQPLPIPRQEGGSVNDVNTVLTRGEYVINVDAVKRLGLRFLNMLNFADKREPQPTDLISKDDPDYNIKRLANVSPMMGDSSGGLIGRKKFHKGGYVGRGYAGGGVVSSGRTFYGQIPTKYNTRPLSPQLGSTGFIEFQKAGAYAQQLGLTTKQTNVALALYKNILNKTGNEALALAKSQQYAERVVRQSATQQQKAGGFLGKLKGFGSGNAAMGLAFAAPMVMGMFDKEGKSPTAQGITGALSGAGMGAMVGSMGGPIGTAVGAAIGGLVGAITSYTNTVKANADALQQAELEKSTKDLADAFQQFQKTLKTADFEKFTTSSESVAGIVNEAAQSQLPGIGRKVALGGENLAVATLQYKGLMNPAFDVAQQATMAPGQFGTEQEIRKTHQKLRRNPNLMAALALQRNPESQKELVRLTGVKEKAEQIPFWGGRDEAALQDAKDALADFESGLRVTGMQIDAENENYQANLRIIQDEVNNASKAIEVLTTTFKDMSAQVQASVDDMAPAQERIKDLFGQAEGRYAIGINARPNVFKNTRGYSTDRLKDEAGALSMRLGGAGSTFDNAVDVSIGGRKLGDEFQQVIAKSIVDLEKRTSKGEEAPTFAKDVLEDNLRDVLSGLPQELQEIIMKPVLDKLKASGKDISGLDVMSLRTLLADEDIKGLTTKGQDAATEILANLYSEEIKARSEYVSGLNQWVALEIKQHTEMADIAAKRITAENEVAEAMGHRLTLAERDRPVDERMQRLTGGKSVDALAQQRQQLIAQREGLEGAKGGIDSRDSSKFDENRKALAEVDKQLGINTEALRINASDTTKLSARMKEIADIEQKREQSKKSIEELATGSLSDKLEAERRARLGNRFLETGGRGMTGPDVKDALAAIRQMSDVVMMPDDIRRSLEEAMSQAQMQIVSKWTGIPLDVLKKRYEEGKAAQEKAAKDARDLIDNQSKAAIALADNSQLAANAMAEVTAALTNLTTALRLITMAEDEQNKFQAAKLKKASPRTAAVEDVGALLANPLVNSVMKLFGFSKGGLIPGGGPNRDTVLAGLTKGEFVVNRNATKGNMGLLEQINSGGVVGFAGGGMVGKVWDYIKNMFSGQPGIVPQAGIVQPPLAQPQLTPEELVKQRVQQRAGDRRGRLGSRITNIPQETDQAVGSGIMMPIFKKGVPLKDRRNKNRERIRAYTKEFYKNKALVAGTLPEPEWPQERFGTPLLEPKGTTEEELFKTAQQRRKPFEGFEGILGAEAFKQQREQNRLQREKDIKDFVENKSAEAKRQGIADYWASKEGQQRKLSIEEHKRNMGDLATQEQRREFRRTGVPTESIKVYGEMSRTRLVRITGRQDADKYAWKEMDRRIVADKIKKDSAEKAKFAAVEEKATDLRRDTTKGYNSPEQLEKIQNARDRREKILHKQRGTTSMRRFIGFNVGGMSDTTLAALTTGEYIVNRQSAQANLPLLKQINAGKINGFNRGGLIPGFNGGGAGGGGSIDFSALTTFSSSVLSFIKEVPNVARSMLEAATKLVNFGDILNKIASMQIQMNANVTIVLQGGEALQGMKKDVYDWVMGEVQRQFGPSIQIVKNMNPLTGEKMNEGQV